jgi:hypothetical protein
LEITTKTIQNWRNDQKVPLMALYALHSLCEAKLGQELVAVVQSLDRIATVLAAIIPSVLPGTPESAGKNSSALTAGAASGR